MASLGARICLKEVAAYEVWSRGERRMAGGLVGWVGGGLGGRRELPEAQSPGRATQSTVMGRGVRSETCLSEGGFPRHLFTRERLHPPTHSRIV